MNNKALIVSGLMLALVALVSGNFIGSLSKESQIKVCERYIAEQYDMAFKSSGLKAFIDTISSEDPILAKWKKNPDWTNFPENACDRHLEFMQAEVGDAAFKECGFLLRDAAGPDSKFAQLMQNALAVCVARAKVVKQ